MAVAADGPMISGVAYTVIEIDGRPPTGLAGCLGDRTLTLVRSGLSHRVRGTGTNHPGGVRFQQKSSARTARICGSGRSPTPVTTSCSPDTARRQNPRPLGAAPRSAEAPDDLRRTTLHSTSRDGRPTRGA